jgi:hypothetical protein
MFCSRMDGVLPGEDKFDMRFYWDTNGTAEKQMETEHINSTVMVMNCFPTGTNPILEIRRVCL